MNDDDIPKRPYGYLSQYIQHHTLGRLTSKPEFGDNSVPPKPFFVTRPDLSRRMKHSSFNLGKPHPLAIKAWQPNEVVMKLTLDELERHAAVGGKVNAIMQVVECSQAANIVIASLMAHARFHYPMGGK